jgi:hypothetical protein
VCRHQAVTKLASITFSRIVCSSPERLNLGFLLREKTCRCAHHTFRLEFPNYLAIIIINYTPAISYLISERGIEGNPEKIQAIINMQLPKTL